LRVLEMIGGRWSVWRRKRKGNYMTNWRKGIDWKGNSVRVPEDGERNKMKLLPYDVPSMAFQGVPGG